MAQPATPQPGSPLRASLMDAIRPLAEYHLGAPIVFEVIEVLAEEDRAFARLWAVRPDGTRIDPAQTPAHLRDGWSLDLFDGPRLEVFYHYYADAWRVERYEIGATDAWWIGYDCENYASFFDEHGCN